MPIADKDIKAHAADGHVINLVDKVKPTGEMSVGVGGSPCVMKASKIEKQRGNTSSGSP